MQKVIVICNWLLLGNHGWGTYHPILHNLSTTRSDIEPNVIWAVPLFCEVKRYIRCSVEYFESIVINNGDTNCVSRGQGRIVKVSVIASTIPFIRFVASVPDQVVLFGTFIWKKPK